MTIGLLGGGQQGGLLGLETNLLGGLLGGGKGGAGGGLLGGLLGAKMDLIQNLLGGLFNGLAGGMDKGNTKQEQKLHIQYVPVPVPTMAGGMTMINNNQAFNQNLAFSHNTVNQNFNTFQNNTFTNIAGQAGVHGNQGPAPFGPGFTIHVDGRGNVSSHLGTDKHFHNFDFRGAQYPMLGATMPAMDAFANQNANGMGQTTQGCAGCSNPCGKQTQANDAIPMNFFPNMDVAAQQGQEKGGIDNLFVGKGLLGFLGPVFQAVHHMAEGLIDAVGLQPLFAPIDAAIVHPLLWDPLSALTGYDVADHPEGIEDVKKGGHGHHHH